MNSKLTELIKLAQGRRSQNIFAMQCELNGATLTKIIRDGQKPTPETLKKLASRADNGVTYTDLMTAAGYLEADAGGESHAPEAEPNETGASHFKGRHPSLSGETGKDILDRISFAYYGKEKPLTRRDEADLVRIVRLARQIREKNKDDQPGED